MRLRPASAAVSALLPLLTAVPLAAAAPPPEGCVGLPDVPEAFVCVVTWTPENAAPTVTPGSTTAWVPEVCVFACVGPTPVTIPLASVTPNSGTVAVVRYRGQDYPISTSSPIPSVGSTAPPPGFVGKGCSLLAVENPTQPGSWLVIVQAGPIVATEPSYELSEYGCVVTVGGWGYIGAGTTNTWRPNVTTISEDLDTKTVGVVLYTIWTDAAGNPQNQSSYATATAAGSARLVG